MIVDRPTNKRERVSKPHVGGKNVDYSLSRVVSGAASRYGAFLLREVNDGRTC